MVDKGQFQRHSELFEFQPVYLKVDFKQRQGFGVL
jgi:hypothetical protein